MLKIASGIDPQKEREILVHIRLQKGLDKQQIIDYVKDKFNTDDKDAERLFYIAYPNGLDEEDKLLIELLDNSVDLSNISPQLIDAISACAIGETSLESVIEKYKVQDIDMVKVLLAVIKELVSSRTML
jgi:hypothetical protein